LVAVWEWEAFMTANDLVGQVMAQLGVGEDQAKGGAGLLLKLAREKLGGDFAEVTKVVPDVQGLIDSAPETGGMGKLVGRLAGTLGGAKAGGLGGLADLAGGFSKLKLDPGMIEKYAGVILSFVKSKGGPAVMQILSKVLKGGGAAS